MQFNWIYLWFQTICVFCYAYDNIPESPLNTLYNIFGYNFSNFPEVGRVIFWNISKDKQIFQPQEYINGTTQFQSKRTYLIVTQTQKLHFCIYYWLGRNILPDDKKAAAKVAILLYALFVKYINSRYEWTNKVFISRETEAMESQSFYNTINFIQRDVGVDWLSTCHQYLDSEFPSQFPNLYVVRGNSTTAIKKVPLGISWILSDICLVLETGYNIHELTPLNMYCGSNASEKSKSRVQAFMHNLHMRYAYVVERATLLIFNNTNRNELKFKIFVEVLEDSSYYKSYDIDESGDHLKDAATFVADRDKTMQQFWIEYHTINSEGANEEKNVLVKRENPLKPFFLQQFHYARVFGVGFIFDSSSIAGLFIHIRQGNTTEEMVTIMAIAEEYIEKKYSSCSVPPRVRIKESYYVMVVIDFLIHLANWPRNPELERRFEHW